METKEKEELKQTKIKDAKIQGVYETSKPNVFKIVDDAPKKGE